MRACMKGADFLPQFNPPKILLTGTKRSVVITTLVCYPFPQYSPLSVPHKSFHFLLFNVRAPTFTASDSL